MTDMDGEHLLMAYADGELDEAAAREAERLIAEDPRARARVELYRGTGALLRSACGEPHYAAGTSPAASRRAPGTRRRVALLAAASIGLGVLGFGVGRGLRAGGEPDLLAEIAEYHSVISRETTHLVELPASQGAEAMAWLGARLSRPLLAPDLASAALHFAGTRLLVFDGQPIADLLYVRAHGAPIALCVARMPGAAQPIHLARRAGLQLATWRRDGYAYVVAGALDQRSARDIADLAAVQLQL